MKRDTRKLVAGAVCLAGFALLLVAIFLNLVVESSGGAVILASLGVATMLSCVVINAFMIRRRERGAPDDPDEPW